MEVDPETDRFTQNQLDNQKKFSLSLNETNQTAILDNDSGKLAIASTFKLN
jgi:hypothetical protein